jgi:hypothetical protein
MQKLAHPGGRRAAKALNPTLTAENIMLGIMLSTILLGIGWGGWSVGYYKGSRLPTELDTSCIAQSDVKLALEYARARKVNADKHLGGAVVIKYISKFWKPFWMALPTGMSTKATVVHNAIMKEGQCAYAVAAAST